MVKPARRHMQSAHAWDPLRCYRDVLTLTRGRLLRLSRVGAKRGASPTGACQAGKRE
jgi:hypothetical protein